MAPQSVVVTALMAFVLVVPIAMVAVLLLGVRRQGGLAAGLAPKAVAAQTVAPPTSALSEPVIKPVVAQGINPLAEPAAA